LRRNKSAGAVTALLVLAGIVFLCATGELILRWTGKYDSYFERNGVRGMDPVAREELREPWLYIHPPGGRGRSVQSEYSQSFEYNSYGFVGAWPPPEKPAGEFRIIAVGDSYTEGVGDPEGLGYVGRLAKSLGGRRGLPRYRVMNAGVAGSDPVYGVELLRHRLLEFRPDLVTITVNSSDIDDIKKRGGFDRFSPEGFLRQQLPWWTGLFNGSHLVRAFVLRVLRYNWMLQSPAENGRRRLLAVNTIVEAGKEAKALADEHHFKVAMLFHPLEWDAYQKNYGRTLNEVKQLLIESGVDVIDILPDFSDVIRAPPPTDYFWTKDLHCTPKGYDVFAQALERSLVKKGWIRK
jgi:lysophospholipase L1-like esterase